MNPYLHPYLYPHSAFRSFSGTSLVTFLILFVIGLFVYLMHKSRQTSRKVKDVYGFNLPEWTLLKDDQKLYEIETDFTQGLIATTLIKPYFDVEDFHSNLVHKNLPAYTGYIRMWMLRGALAFAPMPYELPLSIGSMISRNYSHRYFAGKPNKSIPTLLNLNSSSIINLKVMQLDHLSEELKALDILLGVNNWNLIAHEDKLYILTSELFDHEQLTFFLKLCLIIQSKL